MSLLVIFGILFLIVFIFLWKNTTKPKGFPPGPKWLPIVGCIPLLQHAIQIYKFHHLMWHNFTIKYGSIVGFRIGRDKLIIVSGKESIKEFYSCDEFNARPNGFFFRMRTFNKRLGLVFTDGILWQIQRKFAMKTIKQLFNNKNNINHIQAEAAHMITSLQIKIVKGNLIDMQHLFDVPVLNVMWTLLAGYRFNTEDDRLKMLLEMIHESFRVIDMSGGILNQFPFIRYIFPKQSGYTKLLETIKPIWKFLRTTINEIKENCEYNNKKVANNIIEIFLNEIEKNSNDNSTTFNLEQLLAVCLDFFQAGSETTSNTLGFGIVYMLHYPKVLEKVRNELDRVVGKNKLPTLNDRPNLPYTKAVLYEIQRFSNVAPLAIAHRTANTVNFCGYIIPKNTTALVSLYSLNMDSNLWVNPKVFSPERFLDQNGKLIQYEHFIPFGLGKRRCIGEVLAKYSLFLFFSSFVKYFDVILPECSNLPEMEGLDGITLSPKPYKAYLRKRNENSIP